MQLYTVYLYLETALHVSGGTSTQHQERIQLYLQHLVFVTPLLLSAAIVEELEPVRVLWVAYATHSTLKSVPTEYMYHDRTAWRCAFFVGKNMDAAKYTHKELLPIWVAFLYGYPLLPYFLLTKTQNSTLFYRGTCIQGRRHVVTAATSVQSCPNGQHFFVDILYFHIFCPQKTHVTLFYRGTCIQGRRHLVTAATSLQ
jgi:hypothetical protein